MWKRVLVAVLVVAALAVYVSQVVAGWERVEDSNGRDYASYHYALQVALDDGDPYDADQLAASASEDGTRDFVFPFFYPPPFLLTMVWAAPLELREGFAGWFWLNGLSFLAAAMALWWWRPRWSTLVAIGLVIVGFTPLYNNFVMGQANLPVLALVAWGMALAGRRRLVLGGVLIGVACMLKMSPGLLVAWWLVRREWKPAAAACVTAVVLSLLTLPVLGFDGQVEFYTRVLPSLSAGEYNGLTVPIDIFGNHSIPNLWFQIWPGPGMTDAASRASSLTNLALVVAVFVSLYRSRGEAAGLCALGALSIVLLIVPTFTYEHHVVLAIPAFVAVVDALASRRLHLAWLAVLVPASVVSAWPLQPLKKVALAQSPGLEFALQEIKFLALLVLLVACVVAARSEAGAGPDADSLRQG